MLKDWLTEIRVKSLLLAFSNCVLGCAIGFYYGRVNCFTITTSSLIVITGILLQILSNFADDYGDACKNADGPNRLGPIRAVMIGSISLTSLRKSMALVTTLATFTGCVALIMAVGYDLQVLAYFTFLGVAAVLAAIFYTIGLAYGYQGFGDLAVFIFFGLAAILGSQMLILGASRSGIDLFPDSYMLAVAVGIHSVMVLHIANMRDITEDRLNGKKTIAARLGVHLSAVYLLVLYIISALLSLAACATSHQLWECIIIAFALLPLFATTMRVFIHKHNPKNVASERKYALIGCAIHNLAWTVVLILDFWVYY